MTSFDPRSIPGLPVQDPQSVPGNVWSPGELRKRLASPPAWKPEHIAEGWRSSDPVRRAAVLVGLVLRQHGATVWLTERAAHLRAHAGQISFPGGTQDDTDDTPQATAIREAWEEIGLPEDHIEVLGNLPVHVTGTGFAITPVVALVSPEFVPVSNADEVASVFQVPMSHLMDSRNHTVHEAVIGGRLRRWYAMPYTDGTQERFIWGATAAVLRNLHRLLLA